jgi:hypothetical protein
MGQPHVLTFLNSRHQFTNMGAKQILKPTVTTVPFNIGYRNFVEKFAIFVSVMFS